MTNWHERLLELARAEARVQARNRELKAQINALYDAQIRALEDEIKANEALEAALKADALAEFESTGDLDLHEKITVQRRYKLVYDKDAALRAAEDHGALNFEVKS